MRNILILSIAIAVLTVNLFAKTHKESAIKDSHDTIRVNMSNNGSLLRITGVKGKAFNHPTFSIWLEDTTGKYIQDLFVTKYIATGVFGHVKRTNGQWQEGEKFIPAALPVWIHRRVSKTDIKPMPPSPSNPVADAFTGATPQNNFLIETQLPSDIPNVVKIFFEVNQTWDWNNYWTNNKFPDDADYKTSSQPALVYSVTIDLKKIGTSDFKLLGHSHYSGKNGNINSEISTISTAKNILGKLSIEIVK